MKKNNQKSEGVDQELIEQFRRSLEDIKHGRITEWKPKNKGKKLKLLKKSLGIAKRAKPFKREHVDRLERY